VLIDAQIFTVLQYFEEYTLSQQEQEVNIEEIELSVLYNDEGELNEKIEEERN
jgi:hypothetical protein